MWLRKMNGKEGSNRKRTPKGNKIWIVEDTNLKTSSSQSNFKKHETELKCHLDKLFWEISQINLSPAFIVMNVVQIIF